MEGHPVGETPTTPPNDKAPQMGSLLLLVLQIVTFALLARAILSWVRPEPGSGLWQFRDTIDRLTDPIVLPVRRVLPRPGGIDLSIFAILIGINVVLVPIAAAL